MVQFGLAAPAYRGFRADGDERGIPRRGRWLFVIVAGQRCVVRVWDAMWATAETVSGWLPSFR